MYPRIIYLVLKVPLQVIMIFNQMMLYVALALSENLVNALSGTPDFAYLLNNIYSHKDFQKLASLTFESRYTQYESMNNGYRSFLVSQLLYSILADVFKDWYTDGNGGLEDLRIKEMAPDQIKQLMSEIEEYLQNLKSYSNINITSLEAFDDYETQYDNLKTLYQKIKEISLKKFLNKSTQYQLRR